MRRRSVTMQAALGFSLFATSAIGFENAPLVARATVQSEPVEVVVAAGKLVVRHDGVDMPVELKDWAATSRESPEPRIVSLESATEVAASSWLGDGVAVAIESTDDQGRRTYRWATLRIDLRRRFVGVGATAEFYSGEEDFDVASIRNPAGDSIVILLSRYDRDAKEPFSTIAFEHNCPIGPVAGTLYRLRSEPLDAEAAASQP